MSHSLVECVECGESIDSEDKCCRHCGRVQDIMQARVRYNYIYKKYDGKFGDLVQKIVDYEISEGRQVIS